jgi:hypothetical protein
MRTKVKKPSPELALTRVLDALARELIDTTDEEILAAAKDLRMDPSKRESAAFAGLTYFARPQLSDFFDLPEARKLLGAEPTRTGRRSPTRSRLQLRKGKAPR